MQYGKVGINIFLLVISLFGLVEVCLGSEPSQPFTFEVKMDESSANLNIRLCYTGEKQKEIGDLISTDVTIKDPGNWTPIQHIESPFAVITGSFGPRTINKGDCIPVFVRLANLFSKLTPKQNRIIVALKIRNLSDDKILTLTQELKTDLSPDQANTLLSKPIRQSR